MSHMYRAEVPQYGALLELVAAVNGRTLDKDGALKARLEEAGELEALSEERHGAIRVGECASGEAEGASSALPQARCSCSA